MGKHQTDDPDTAQPLHQPYGRFPVLKRIAIVLAIGVTVGALAAAGTAMWLNNSLANIEKIDVTVKEENRPERASGEALNILLLGADAGTKRNGPGTSIIKDATKEVWPRGKYRSDATMLVHINADRSKAYVVSIPRDSYLPVHDQIGQQQETTKINAALSLYGPSGALSTVETFADQRVDHLAMVDWDGFEDITDAVGGVTITTPGEGKRTLDGKEALEYVRERKNLPDGDFSRVKRQQNFLRSMTTKMIKRGTLLNPIKLKKTLNSITKNLATDDAWDNGDIRSLAYSMRGLDPDDVTFLTIPTKGTRSDPVAGSIVVVDHSACDELFRAMEDDDMASWVKDHDATVLEEGSEKVD